MNTKSKQDQKNKGQRTRQENGPKKRSQTTNMPQDHEHPETRMTR